jgi:hypothetical protein
MLANPAFERPIQIEQSSSGDTVFNDIAGASAFDPGQVQGIAEAVKSARAVAMLFEAGAKNQKISRLAAAVMGYLTRSSHSLDIEPTIVVEQRSFLQANADLNPITDFLKKLSKASEVLTLLASQPFEVDRALFYRTALNAATETESVSYSSYLAEGILGLDKGQWDKSLNAGSGAYFELLELAFDLRKRNDGFALSIPARDAALDQIRKVGNGKPAPSDEVRGWLTKLVELLPDGLRSSLMRDVTDEMAGQSDAANLTRRIEIAGDHLTLADETDPDRIVRRILSPAIGNPSERSAAWMATVIGRRLEFFRQMPYETRNEFVWRLRTALQNKETLAPPVVESLTNIAGLLETDLSSPETESSAAPTSEAAQ